MNDLLTLEPRKAGPTLVDPVVEFNDGFYADRSRTRCYGCCCSCSTVEILTNSYAG